MCAFVGAGPCGGVDEASVGCLDGPAARKRWSMGIGGREGGKGDRARDDGIERRFVRVVGGGDSRTLADDGAHGDSPLDRCDVLIGDPARKPREGAIARGDDHFGLIGARAGEYRLRHRFAFALIHGIQPVSYTHLTLPTILRV